jgi:hypothetical protein
MRERVLLVLGFRAMEARGCRDLARSKQVPFSISSSSLWICFDFCVWRGRRSIYIQERVVLDLPPTFWD